jgi:hypothetical protein
MKISELPTPRLRARAMELALAENKERSARWDYNLDEAFVWRDTEEDREFWLACYEGNWDKAKELEPSLFKPMDGKPHFAVRKYEMPEDEFYGLIVENCELFEVGDLELCWKYIQEVDPEEHTTIQEAVDALYSFKRGDANERP